MKSTAVRLQADALLPSPGGQTSSREPDRVPRLIRLWRRHFHRGRGGRAKLALTSSLVSRVVLSAVSLVTMPMTVRYLGNEGYGLMVLMSSVVGWLQFSSLGIGVALQNPLTQARVQGDVRKQRELLSTAVFALLAIALVLVVAGGIAFPLVNWLEVFPPTSDRFLKDIPTALGVVFFGFVSSVVLSFVGPVYAARQELHLGSIPVLAAGLLSFVGILTAVHFDLGLLGVVSASVGIGAVVQWTFAVWTLSFRGIPELRPAVTNCSLEAWRSLFGRGFSFLLLQLCTIAFFQVDAFIIAHFLSTAEVTPYSVAQKVFVQVAGLFAIVSGSMWSAYGDAKAARDVAWIRRSQRTIERIFLLAYGGLALVMISGGHYLLRWWVGEAAAPGTLLIAGVACYFCAREWTALHAVLLNGLDIIRPQVWVLAVTAVLILTLNIVFVRSFGVVGLALGGFLGFSALSAWYLPLLAKRTLIQMERESPPPATVPQMTTA